MKLIVFRAIAVVAVLMLAACGAPANAVADAESVYADLVDAQGVVGAIDSGLFAEYRGKSRREWEAEVRTRQQELATALARIPETAGTDARVRHILQSKLDSFSTKDDSPTFRCADAQRKDTANPASRLPENHA